MIFLHTFLNETSDEIWSKKIKQSVIRNGSCARGRLEMKMQRGIRAGERDHVGGQGRDPGPRSWPRAWRGRRTRPGSWPFSSAKDSRSLAPVVVAPRRRTAWRRRRRTGTIRRPAGRVAAGDRVDHLERAQAKRVRATWSSPAAVCCVAADRCTLRDGRDFPSRKTHDVR